MRRRGKLGCTEHSHRVRRRKTFAHEELKMSRIQPSCELHLGGSERERDRHREGLRRAGGRAPSLEEGHSAIMTLIYH